MKKRITYINVDSNADFDPSQLQVKQNALHVKELKAAREFRQTYSLEELPEEILVLLSDAIQRLNLRWSSPQAYIHAGPLVSRTSPGLYISAALKPDYKAVDLCLVLKRAFGPSIKCASPQDSFTARKNSLTSSSFDELEYYANLESLHHLATAMTMVCQPGDSACLARAASLEKIDSLGVDLDRNSSSLTIRAYQGHSDKGISSQDSSDGSIKTEIGVLGLQKATEPDHIKLGGYLVTLGEDDKLKPTLFQFPSRHHEINSRFSPRFVEPTGLHPTLALSITSYTGIPAAARPETCSLYTYLTLPSPIFPDKYQLSNDLLLESLRIKNVHSISGYTDLEAPEYAVPAWGSSMLLELDHPDKDTTENSLTWNVNIPLHLRYLSPTDAANGLSSTDIPWPVVFWACKADSETELSGNPFDRTNLGYDALFEPDTVFYHWQPAVGTQSLVNTIQVPVLWTTTLFEIDSGLLEIGTSIVVLSGWIWVVWLLFEGWFYRKKSSAGVKEKKEK